MTTLPVRWRAAGFAALFLLTTWACNCGTFQQLASPGGAAADTPTAIPLPTEAPTLPPPTEAPALPPPTEAPTLPPAATPTGSGVLFEDDFSNPNSGWYIDNSEFGTYAIQNGVYAITTGREVGVQLWGDAGRSFVDTIITVDATQISAPANNNNAYGVGCRIQPETYGDGYFARIAGDGYYAIFKYVTTDQQTGDGDFVTLVDWTPTGAVNQGNATNVIEVSCIGSTISLSVNGQFLGSAQDSTYTSGDIAMTATTFEEEPVTVHFDNVVVREP